MDHLIKFYITLLTNKIPKKIDQLFLNEYLYFDFRIYLNLNKILKVINNIVSEINKIKLNNWIV